ncbi:retrotransposon protein, putative, ty1-copia subclass [Tanacetum coccineum]
MIARMCGVGGILESMVLENVWRGVSCGKSEVYAHRLAGTQHDTENRKTRTPDDDECESVNESETLEGPFEDPDNSRLGRLNLGIPSPSVYLCLQRRHGICHLPYMDEQKIWLEFKKFDEGTMRSLEADHPIVSVVGNFAFAAFDYACWREGEHKNLHDFEFMECKYSKDRQFYHFYMIRPSKKQTAAPTWLKLPATDLSILCKFVLANHKPCDLFKEKLGRLHELSRSLKDSVRLYIRLIALNIFKLKFAEVLILSQQLNLPVDVWTGDDCCSDGTQQCPNQNKQFGFQDVFETPLPPAPAASADNQALADWNALFDRHNEVACLMLGTMSPKLYQQFENKSPQEMITELQKMYGKPPGVELQELVNMFHSCKQAEGQSVSDHVLLMKSYLDQLATLNYAFHDKVSISFILNSLSSEFQAFVQNYNMQSMEKTISEVHSLLIKFEKSIKRNKQQIVGASSTPHVMAIQSGRVQKNKPQGKAKGKEKGKGLKNSYPTKPKKPQPYKKEHPTKDGKCHHCKEEGHWKRKCPLYLAELMKKKKTGGQNVASTSSGIYTIELFAFPKNSWVYDTGCGTHICNTKQGLRGAKKLKRGSLYLYVGNGVRVEVEVFKNEVENQLGMTIKAIRSDRSGEYISVMYLLNMARSMMSLTTLPLSFWDYALESAARILNMVPTKKVWGCEAHVKRHTPDKLQQRSVKCIFVGYPKETMGYYFYHQPENKIVVEMYANLLEKDFILQKESGRNVELVMEAILPLKTLAKHPNEEEIDPDRLSFNIKVEEHSLGDLNKPANYKVALLDPEFEKWLVAMNEEMQFMNDNKVWKLIVLQPNAKVVKSKWIYKVYIYKTRLVAKGFTQTYGVDYEETFSPVADIRAIRILIAIAAYYDYEIWQMDVKTAFLNGFLEEEIYMEQPEGFIDPNHPSKVCKLQRSIYGLKQASRSWNKRFDEEIKKFGFHQNLDEPFFKKLRTILCATTSTEMKRMQYVPYALANPGKAYWTAMKNILKYLRNTNDTFLVYGGNPEAELQVKCYCDAGFETDKDRESRPFRETLNLKKLGMSSL